MSKRLNSTAATSINRDRATDPIRSVIRRKSSLAAADLRAMGAVQHLGAAIVAGVALLTVGTGQWDDAPSLWLALAWSVMALSLVGTLLYIWTARA